MRNEITLFLVLGFGGVCACNGDGNGTPADDAGPTTVESVALELVAEGLTSPTYLKEAPDDSERLFIVDQVGLIRILPRGGALLSTPFLDVQDRMVELMPEFDERGLLGLDFHPSYADNGRLFVYYSSPLRAGAPEGYDHTSRISEFTVMAEDANRVDPDSERILLEIDQPQFNHDGGAVAFGPDGFLYVSLGDGGGANDVGLGHPPIGNGQDRTTLLGSILRLDVDGAEPYGIPEDNPFVGEEGRDEIFAYGFRNPFRMSFDQGGDRELFVGDVGQDRWEEVDRVTLGGNYGWNIKEGTHCFDPDNPEESPASCPDVGPQGSPLVDPILEYQNANAEDGIGLAVVGGFVYRGSDIPGLAGEYVFGDWSESFSEPRGKIFAAPLDEGEDGLLEMRELSIGAEPNGELGSFLLALGQDARGEMYALGTQNTGPTGTTGRVYRLTQAEDPEPRPDAGVGDAGPGGDADMDGDAGQALTQQLSRGQTVFANNCSTCHGDNGMGTALGPALIGATALPKDPPADREIRTGQFTTALDVFEFASENMPADAPGSLPTQDYLDVVAFALDANGVDLNEVLTAANADQVVINP